MLKIMKSFLIAFVLLLLISTNFTSVSANDEWTSASVGYQVKTENQWQDLVFGGALSGSEGSANLQSLSVHLVDAPEGASIQARVYSAGVWSPWSDAYTNTEDRHLFSGLQLKLTNYETGNVYYQVYRKGLGWGAWVKNGVSAGRLDDAYPITGLRIKVVEVGVSYTSSVSSKTITRANAETLDSGLIETFKVNLQKPTLNGGIEYRVHLKDLGWTDWAKNGQVLGQSGSKLGIEALEARLINMPGFSVAYQVEIKGQGWTDWKYNGETSGSTGLSTPILAYRMKIVKGVTRNTTDSTDASNQQDNAEISSGFTRYLVGFDQTPAITFVNNSSQKDRFTFTINTDIASKSYYFDYLETFDSNYIGSVVTQIGTSTKIKGNINLGVSTQTINTNPTTINSNNFVYLNSEDSSRNPALYDNKLVIIDGNYNFFSDAFNMNFDESSRESYNFIVGMKLGDRFIFYILENYFDTNAQGMYYFHPTLLHMVAVDLTLSDLSYENFEVIRYSLPS